MLELLRNSKHRQWPTYLVSAGTWFEVLVGEVKLFDTERTRLLLFVVDELVLV